MYSNASRRPTSVSAVHLLVVEGHIVSSFETQMSRFEMKVKFSNLYSASESYYLYIGKASSAPLC